MKVLLLYDRKIDNNFSYSILKQCHDNVVLIDNKKNDASLISWLRGAYKAVRMAKKDDIIIGLFDFQAILCYWLSLFLFKSCRIIVVNLMLQKKNTAKNKLTAILYKIAIRSRRVSATITSQSLSMLYNNRFGTAKSYTVLHDIYAYKHIEQPFEDCGRSVFMGGLNGRDWSTAFKVAEMMPNITFYFVSSEYIYIKYKNKYPNIFLYCNISFNQFIEIQRRCSITYLPLTTQMPAGLIVMYQAAALNRFIIISDTPTTREYITENSGCLVNLYDVNCAVEKIHFFIEHIELRKEKSDNLKQYLQRHCSEKTYLDTVKRIIYQTIEN